MLAGDPTLSVRGDTAEECWRIVEPVLAAWAAGEVPLEEYAAGSAGPGGWATSRSDGPGGVPAAVRGLDAAGPVESR